MLPTKLILTVRFAVFAEATLAFVGLADRSAVSWGGMLSEAFSDPLLFDRPVLALARAAPNARDRQPDPGYHVAQQRDRTGDSSVLAAPGPAPWSHAPVALTLLRIDRRLHQCLAYTLAELVDTGKQSAPLEHRSQMALSALQLRW